MLAELFAKLGQLFLAFLHVLHEIGRTELQDADASEPILDDGRARHAFGQVPQDVGSHLVLIISVLVGHEVNFDKLAELQAYFEHLINIAKVISRSRIQ